MRRGGGNSGYYHQSQGYHHHGLIMGRGGSGVSGRNGAANGHHSQSPQVLPYAINNLSPHVYMRGGAVGAPSHSHHHHHHHHGFRSGVGSLNGSGSNSIGSTGNCSIGGSSSSPSSHVNGGGTGSKKTPNSLSVNSGGGGGSGGSISGRNHSYSPDSVSNSSHGVGDMPPVETVVARLETACRLLHGIGGNNTKINEISQEIGVLSEDLRHVGPLLETSYPDVLDRVMSSMRDASAQPSLPPNLRLAIFELVESRAAKWMLPSDSSNYYRQRRNISDSKSDSPDASHPTTSSSRLISKPEPIYSLPTYSSQNSSSPSGESSSKSYREEILIKNSDSGKVSPTAKERCLTINGSSLQTIILAKQLIQETITRNASPVFDGVLADLDGTGEVEEDSNVSPVGKKLSSLSNTKLDEICRFTYSVNIGSDVIKISGSNLQHVQEAKLALDQYFSTNHGELFNGSDEIQEQCIIEEGETEEDDIIDNSSEQHESQEFNKNHNICNGHVTKCLDTRKIYGRDELLEIARIACSSYDFGDLGPELRESIVSETPRCFDVDKYCEKNWKSRNSIGSLEIKS